MLTEQIRLPRNRRQAAQSVVLTGLGLDKFEHAVQAVLQIYNHFSRNLPQGSLTEWEPQVVNGHLTLPFSNRYLSSFEEAQGMEQVPIPKEVDPNGVLRKSVQKVYHTSDNEVLYFERVPAGDNR